MKKFLFATVFLVSATLVSCESNEKAAQEEQEHTEQHDSMQHSVLEEADRTLNEGNFDTTKTRSDSAGMSK